MEFLDEDLSEDLFKYVDDLTIEEAIDGDVSCIIDNTGDRPIHTFNPKKVQESFD